MKVEISITQIYDAIEDYFIKNGIRIKKDSIKLEYSDYNYGEDKEVSSAKADLESVFN